MTIRDYVEKYTDDMIQDIQDLIAIESVEDTPKPGMPFGEGCAKVLNECLKKGERLGFRSKNLDNYAGYLEIGTGKELIGVLTHVDVVPAGDLSHWQYPPFGRTFVNNKLYGRGANDNKGPTIFAMYAMKILADMGVPLNKRIRHIIGANEETGFQCMEHYNQVEEPLTWGFSPDAKFPVIFSESGAYGLEVTGKINNSDPITITDLHGGHAHNIVADNCVVTLSGCQKELEKVAENFQKYASSYHMNSEVNLLPISLTMTLHGSAAHASVPWDGVNAIAYMMDFLSNIVPHSPFVLGFNKLIGTDYYGKNCGIACQDDYSKLTLCIGTLSYCQGTDEATASLDIRFPVTVDFDKQYADLLTEAFLAEGFSTTYTGTDKPVFVDPHSDFIQALLAAYREVTGDMESQPLHSGGGTYAKSFDHCVAYGIVFPGNQEVAHLSDEYITLDEMQDSVEIFVRALLKILAL